MMNRLPQPEGPESVPARGSRDGGQDGEAEVRDGGGASQRYLEPHLDVEVAVRSGHSGELEAIRPSPSTPSISHGGKPDGT